MSRVLIAIGCDQYDIDGLDNLSGAENDAKKIFTKLVIEEKGQFNKHLSKLLLAPTLSEIKTTFEESLFGGGEIECLTIYYAGHGIVKDGVYYLTSRDSDPAKLSVSGLSTSTIFSYINEARCGHTNIIMDSCEAGGIVNDIGSLLKPEIIGRANAISVSILAASASNQGAGEDGGQGFCTKAILDCIDGKLETFSSHATLDLNDLGKAIAPEFSSYTGQNPEYWGISLKGHVPFFLNPTFNNDVDNDVFSFAKQVPLELNDLLGDSIDQIWRQYFALNEGFEHSELFYILRDCVVKLEDHPSAAIGFIRSVCSSFIQKMSAKYTPFEEAEVLGVGLTSILRLANKHEDVDVFITELGKEIVLAVNKGMSILIAEMMKDKFHLLSSGFAELYYLPLRISKILGWIGASIHLADLLDIEQSTNEIQLLINKIIEDYSPSVFAVSDNQSPHLACFSSGANSIGLIEESEAITCLMFCSFLQVSGKIASTAIKPEQIIKYQLFTENNESVDLEEGSLARPSELLALFFVLYETHGLTDELDQCLSQLDHSSMNIYIPSKYKTFGEERISEGQNYTSQIGHGVWVFADFEQRWLQILEHISGIDDIKNQSIYLGAIIASLIDNNRVPWFLFAKNKNCES